jgi:hypothetical protein
MPFVAAFREIDKPLIACGSVITGRHNAQLHPGSVDCHFHLLQKRTLLKEITKLDAVRHLGPGQIE